MRQRTCFDDHGARKSYPTFSLVVGSSFRGLRSRDDFSFFSEPNLSFAGLQFFWCFFVKNCTAPVSILRLYRYFGDFPKKTVDQVFWFLQSYSYFGDFQKKTVRRPFRFFSRTVILEVFRKKLYNAHFDFAVVPLFWRFREKNCRPPVSILRSYSYFGDFPKKRYSLHFDFAVIQLFLENSRKKLYFNYFGFNFDDAWRVLIQGS